MLEFQVIKKTDTDPKLVQFWKQCACTIDPTGSPLLSPEYCDQMDAVCDDVEVGLIKNNCKLVGILPFQRRNATVARPLGGHISDSHGFLTMDKTISARDWISGLGLCRFDFDHLVGPVDERFVFARDSCYRIDLSGGFDNYLFEMANRSKLVQQAMRKKRGLFRDFGSIRFAWSVDPELNVDRLIEWKRGNLSKKGCKDPFESWVTQLMQNLLGSQHDECYGVLSGLYVGSEPAALHLGIASQSCLVSWLPCINPKFDKYSPGSILYLELAEYASRIGIRFIDLGRGENQTKVRLANDCTSMAIGSVCTSSFKLHTLRGIHSGKRWLKCLKHFVYPK